MEAIKSLLLAKGFTITETESFAICTKGVHVIQIYSGNGGYSLLISCLTDIEDYSKYLSEQELTSKIEKYLECFLI